MQPFEKFSQTTILVIGDVMLDRYWWGSVGRISPEAPVPVVRLDKTSLAPGGAANVAVNISGLGARPVLLGIVGLDTEAESLKQILTSSGVEPFELLEIEGRPTTVKTRVIAHNQQVVRIDQEADYGIGEETEDRVEKRIKALVLDADAVVLSDYAKGLLTDRILSSTIAFAKQEGKPVLVDPKGKDYRKYGGASLITPNRREAAEACNLSENSSEVVETAGARLLMELQVDAVLITQGEEGMTLFRRDLASTHFPAAARKVYDVTGAGDTVIAALATAMGSGSGLDNAIRIANAAAGIAVEQVGTTAVSLDDVRDAMI